MWILTLIGAALAASPAELLSQGMAAQRAGNVDAALQHYQACLDQAPDHSGCNWEIGWSYWTKGDWAKVVAHWQRVKVLDPGHGQVDKHLPNAQSQLQSLQVIEATATQAPASVRPALPEGRTIRLRAVGDIMMGTDFPGEGKYLPPDDGATMLDAVSASLQDADVTFGNLEGPLCDGGATIKD